LKNYKPKEYVFFAALVMSRAI